MKQARVQFGTHHGNHLLRWYFPPTQLVEIPEIAGSLRAHGFLNKSP